MCLCGESGLPVQGRSCFPWGLDSPDVLVQENDHLSLNNKCLSGTELNRWTDRQGDGGNVKQRANKISEGGQGCAAPGKRLRFDQESMDLSPLIPGQKGKEAESREQAAALGPCWLPALRVVLQLIYTCNRQCFSGVTDIRS